MDCFSSSTITDNFCYLNDAKCCSNIFKIWTQSVTLALRANANVNCFLVRPKDPVDPRKQDGVVFKIPCECGKVYIGETGRCMHEPIKKHKWDIRLSRTQSSAVSEHANQTGHYPLRDEVYSPQQS